MVDLFSKYSMMEMGRWYPLSIWEMYHIIFQKHKDYAYIIRRYKDIAYFINNHFLIQHWNLSQRMSQIIETIAKAKAMNQDVTMTQIRFPYYWTFSKQSTNGWGILLTKGQQCGCLNLFLPAWRLCWTKQCSGQGADSIYRYHFTSIGNLIVEIRRSYDRLISTMGFPILVRWHLCIESGLHEVHVTSL